MGHVGPPLATALASTLNVVMLYRVLRKRGHFEADRAAEAPPVPRLALAALIMGGVVFVARALCRSLAHPLAASSAASRWRCWSAAAPRSMRSACFLTGAFAIDDLKTPPQTAGARRMTTQEHEARCFRHPADRQSPSRQLSRRDPALGADAGRGRVPVLPRRPPRDHRLHRSRPSCAPTSTTWPPP